MEINKGFFYSSALLLSLLALSDNASSEQNPENLSETGRNSNTEPAIHQSEEDLKSREDTTSSSHPDQWIEWDNSDEAIRIQRNQEVLNQLYDNVRLYDSGVLNYEKKIN